MQKLFEPAVALMNRLKYPQKFSLISLFFILPLVLVIILLISAINERIDFTQKEVYGNTYLRPLRTLLEHTLHHKILARNYLGGETALEEALLNYEARIDEDFKALEAVNRELGETLKTAEAFKALQASWQDLKNKTTHMEVTTSDELHGEFITAIRALISLVGNNSNLILDPNLDSYYLMDTILLKLPENQVLLAQISLLGEQALTQKSLTVEDQEQLIVLAGLVQSNLQATKNGMGSTFRNNSGQNLRLILSSSLEEFSIITEMFVETVRQELIDGPITQSQLARERYSASASQALAASFKLWDQTSLELDSLLQARIARFTRQKYLAGIITIVGLGLASYLWVGFYLAVMRTVSSLDEAAKQMISGNTRESVNLDNQDELGRVVVSFNEIAKALVEVKAELEQRVKERTTELSRTNEQLKAEIVERKQTEIALQESRIFLHDIYTGVGMAIFVVDVAADQTFRYVGVNPAYERLVGLKSTEIEGRTLEELIPIIGAEAVADVRCNYEQCLQTNQVIYKENQVLWQGQEIWYLDQLTPIHNTQDQIIRIMGSTVDITKVKQAEKALRQSQQAYEGLVNSIDGIVWEADAATFEFSFVSRRAERLLGYPVARWLAEPNFWADHIYPDDRGPALDFCLAATRDKRDHEFEYRMVTMDGRLVWLRDIVTVVIEHDRPVKLRGVMVDISEGKQAEEALSRYADRLEVLHEIDQAILAAHSPEEIAQAALGHIRRLVPCRRAGVGLLDDKTNEVVILAIEAGYESQLKAGSRLPMERYRQMIDELQQGRIFRHQAIALSPDHPTADQAGISIPLLTNEELIGAVSLWSDDLKTFSEENMNIAREVADQVAIALRQARLFEAEAQRRQEAEALRDTAAALNSTLNIDEILERILRNIDRVVPHDAANVMLIEAGIARIVRGHGYAERGLKDAVEGLRFTVADMVHQRWMVETGQPVVVRDARADAGGFLIPETHWVCSYIGAPLRAKGQVIGFLFLDSAICGFYTLVHAERLQAFADQAAIALEHAHLYAETKQRAEHLAVLHELDQAITASTNLDDVYRAFSQHILRLLSCDHMSIGLIEGDHLQALFPAEDVSLTPVKTMLSLKNLGGASWVIQQDQPLLSDDLTSDDRFPPSQPAIALGLRSAMILPLRIKGQVIGTWFLGRRQVKGYQPGDLTIAQSMADQLAIAIENTRLFEQVQHYATELEQRVTDRTRELSALYDVTAVASESLDLPTTLKRSLERVVGAMRSQAGTIHLLDETGEASHLAVHQGLPAELTVQLETRLTADSLPGWVIQQGDPLIVPDLASDPRTAEASRSLFQAYLGVPLRARGQILGVIGVARAREQPQFNVEEVALLTTIADQVGVVVESARLRQLAEQSAVMEERARLARDLHDSVTQLLYSINLFAAVGRNAYKLEDMAQVSNCLDELEQIALQALKEMRLLVYELRPLALAQEGLVGALQQRLDAVEKRAGVQTELHGNISLDLPIPIEEALYHISQEALNNALKHAGATAITIRIETIARQIELEVIDNGSGFDLQPDTGGLGLTNMRERVEKLGGTLTLLSAPGQGTTVRVSVVIP